jgi:hypothetical protein
MGSRAAQPSCEADKATSKAIMKALSEASGASVALQGGVAIAVFTTGYGDRSYDTWLGRDARGEIAMIRFASARLSRDATTTSNGLVALSTAVRSVSTMKRT